MKKVLFASLMIALMALGNLTAREVVGHISTDNVLVEYGIMSKPILTNHMPKLNSPAIMIKYPASVMDFLEKEGISSEDMTGLFVSDELAEKVFSICEGQSSEFCSIMCNIVGFYKNSRYETYVVQIGSLYWTVHA